MKREDVEPWLRVAYEIYRKEPVPSGATAEQLARLAVDMEDNAFFSSRVENMRFLQRAQNLIFDYLSRTVEDVVGPDGVTRKALAVASRGQFTALMRDFMVAEGMATEEEFPDVNHGGLADIRSQARLELIFDTNVNMAYASAQKAAGMTPSALESFPAWELVRIADRMEPRFWPARWRQAGGEFFPGLNEAYPMAMGRIVALKTDPIWANLGSKSLFKDAIGTDMPPFAWRSGMGWRQVSKAEWEAGGKVTPKSQKKPESLNPRAIASTSRIDPELKRKALEELRKRREARGELQDIGQIARERAAQVRAELDKPWPPVVREEGDSIVLD